MAEHTASIRLRIVIVTLSLLALSLGIGQAIRVMQEHNEIVTLTDPFFIFLIPAAVLTALTILSLFLKGRNFRIASIVFIIEQISLSLATRVILFPLALSIVAILILNLTSKHE